MQIRKEQLVVIQHNAERAFRLRVADYLREYATDYVSAFSESDLDNDIKHWQGRALSYDITSERALAKWCFLSAISTVAFDEIPEIHNFLRSPIPDPDTKVDILMETLTLRVELSEAKNF